MNANYCEISTRDPECGETTKFWEWQHLVRQKFGISGIVEIDDSLVKFFGVAISLELVSFRQVVARSRPKFKDREVLQSKGF